MDLIQRSFTLMSIHPTPGTSSIKFRNIAVGVLFLTFEIALLISSAAFFYKNVQNDLETSLYALLQISAFCHSCYMLVIGFKHRQVIQQLFDEFKIIQNQCKSAFELIH